MNQQPKPTIDQEEPILSLDSLFDGEIFCHQYVNGYRFSVDSLLVADFLPLKKNCSILDLGAGSGIISLILSYRHKQKNISLTCFERQTEMAELCRKNISYNGFDRECSVVQGDLREIRDYFKPECFDYVISNPPFFPLGRGRTSSNEQAYQARHHVAGGLSDFLKATAMVLKNKGRAVFIYPADHLAEFIDLARKNRLEPKRMRSIYNYPEGENEARLFMIDCQKNGGLGLKIGRPFYVYKEKNGDYSSEMLRLYEKNESKTE